MKTRTKIFFLLWAAAVIATLLVIPYIFSLQGELLQKAGITYSTLFLISLTQGVIIFGIASFFGLILAEKAGFKLPLLSAWFEKRKINYRKTLLLSIIIGLIVGAAIFILDKFVFQSMISDFRVPLWQGFLACFYGGIVEEIVMRLFLMSLLVFILMKIFRSKINNPIIIWVSIILISVLFGLGHLPITSAVVGITPWIIFRAILLNGLGGVVFGWLYWKKGLESAIISHFSADVVLQVIAPVLLR